jgi:hypothetical protein
VVSSGGVRGGARGGGRGADGSGIGRLLEHEALSDVELDALLRKVEGALKTRWRLAPKAYGRRSTRRNGGSGLKGARGVWFWAGDGRAQVSSRGDAAFDLGAASLSTASTATSLGTTRPLSQDMQSARTNQALTPQGLPGNAVHVEDRQVEDKRGQGGTDRGVVGASGAGSGSWEASGRSRADGERRESGGLRWRRLVRDGSSKYMRHRIGSAGGARWVQQEVGEEDGSHVAAEVKHVDRDQCGQEEARGGEKGEGKGTDAGRWPQCGRGAGGEQGAITEGMSERGREGVSEGGWGGGEEEIPLHLRSLRRRGEGSRLEAARSKAVDALNASNLMSHASPSPSSAISPTASHLHHARAAPQQEVQQPASASGVQAGADEPEDSLHSLHSLDSVDSVGTLASTESCLVGALDWREAASIAKGAAMKGSSRSNEERAGRMGEAIQESKGVRFEGAEASKQGKAISEVNGALRDEGEALVGNGSAANKASCEGVANKGANTHNTQASHTDAGARADLVFGMPGEGPTPASQGAATGATGKGGEEEGTAPATLRVGEGEREEVRGALPSLNRRVKASLVARASQRPVPQPGSLPTGHPDAPPCGHLPNAETPPKAEETPPPHLKGLRRRVPRHLRALTRSSDRSQSQPHEVSALRQDAEASR